jgi:hypothetical protein
MTQILLTQNLQTVNELEYLYDRDFNLWIAATEVITEIVDEVTDKVTEAETEK